MRLTMGEADKESAFSIVAARLTLSPASLAR
jgi:hypothetical protein